MPSDPKKDKPGPDIAVNDVVYKTIIDEDGVQRFLGNPIVAQIHDTLIRGTSAKLDLDTIWTMYRTNQDAIREYYRLIRTSICGYADVFPGDEIDNPMWNASKP